jgi:cyclopropane fatty-acyl-phospholipid synthase-like methyltransferase
MQEKITDIHDRYCDTCLNRTNIISKTQYQKAEHFFEFAYRDVMPTNKEARIVDIGCGMGHFLYFLISHGYRNFTGIDRSRQNINYCRQNITDKVTQTEASEYLAKHSDQFDMITAHDVLEHIPKQELLNLLKLIYLALKKNAVFAARVPNMSNPFALDSRYRDFTHENGFTDRSIYQVLSLHGYRKIRISSTPIISGTLRSRMRKAMVAALHSAIRFFYYIQDFSVPRHLGRNLIIICKK